MNRPHCLDIIWLSSASQSDFIACMNGIYEHSPWVAARAWFHRPFASLDALFSALQQTVASASLEEQLQLIRAHPELAGQEARSGTLTSASQQEQQGAGLDQCSADELAMLRDLNHTYRLHHGFPVIVAVKGLSRHDIISRIAARLGNDSNTEMRTCIEEIGKIARHRLHATLESQTHEP